MAKKDQYVTDNYIKEVSHYLYNDLPIPSELTRAKHTHDFNKEVADKLMKKGEKYIQLSGEEHVVLTNFGRYINTTKVKQYIPKFTPNSLLLYIASVSVNTREIFEQQGWEFDLDKIYKRYKRYNWSFSNYERYLKDKN